jgi:glycerol-3-phosphate acyltransferase PlsY
MLKGFLAVFLARMLFDDETVMGLVAAAVVLGHNFPVYLKFKGGKGVATSFGVILAFSPWMGALCLLVWLLTAFIWRFSSLSALIAFACYPLMIFATNSSPQKPQAALSLFLFGMIYYRHRENIKRLIAGTEPKIGKK